MWKRKKFPLRTRLEIWEADYGRFNDWVLEKGGLQFAKLRYIQNPEAFWALYETTITVEDISTRQDMLTPQFWEKINQSELSWRNDYFGCSTNAVTPVLHAVESSDKIILQLRYLGIDDIEAPDMYERFLLWVRRFFRLNKHRNVIGSKWKRNSYTLKERLEIWESNYGRSTGWFLEKSGQQIARLRYLETPDMFWDLYEVNITTNDLSLRQRMLTAEFWDHETYEDLGWRSAHFNFYTQFVLPVLVEVKSSNVITLQIRYLYTQNISSPTYYEKALLWLRSLFTYRKASSLPRTENT